MNLLPTFFKYERGSKVDFLGNQKYKPFQGTYIWAILKHESYNVAFIEHPDGLLKKDFEAKVPFMGGEIIIADNHFDPLKKYIEVTEYEIVLSDLTERENRNNIIRNMIGELHKLLSR